MRANHPQTDESFQSWRLEGEGSGCVCDRLLMVLVDGWKCILLDLDELSDQIIEKGFIWNFNSQILNVWHVIEIQMTTSPLYFSILPHEYEWSDRLHLILP